VRLVQGVGAALMFPQVFATIQVLLPESQRHRAFGILGAVIGLSTIVGQVVGGLLIQADLFGSSWRPVFLINVPIGLVTLVLAARLVPESRAQKAHRIDLLGVLVLTVALFLLVVPLIQGGQSGWPAWSWWSLGASVPAFAAFALVQRWVAARGRTPLVALRLLVQRPFVVGMSLVLVAYAALNSFFLILSLTLQDGLGASALGAGLVYAPQAVCFLATSLLAGRLAPRMGRRLLELGGVVTTLGFAATVALAAATGPHLSAGALIPTLLVQGVGQGLLLTPLINAVLSRTGRENVGLASGVLSTAQQVGGALGVAVVGMIFFGALGRSGGGAGGYAHALAVAAIFNVAVAAVATVLVLALPKAK
jgi:MFS family permease